MACISLYRYTTSYQSTLEGIYRQVLAVQPVGLSNLCGYERLPLQASLYSTLLVLEQIHSTWRIQTGRQHPYPAANTYDHLEGARNQLREPSRTASDRRDVEEVSKYERTIALYIVFTLCFIFVFVSCKIF